MILRNSWEVIPQEMVVKCQFMPDGKKHGHFILKPKREEGEKVCVAS